MFYAVHYRCAKPIHLLVLRLVEFLRDGKEIDAEQLLKVVKETAVYAHATLGSKMTAPQSAPDGPHEPKLSGAPQLNRYVL